MRLNQPAPDVEADAIAGGRQKKVRLSDYRGKWLVFFFYPKDETSVCKSEVLEFNKELSKFREAGAEIASCSVQSLDDHSAWQEKMGKINYPMLSDPDKKIARAFGVLLEDMGIAARATFLIDPEGVVKWMSVSMPFVARSTDETFRALKALQTGDLCPVNWKPGEKTLGKP